MYILSIPSILRKLIDVIIQAVCREYNKSGETREYFELNDLRSNQQATSH